MSKAYDGRTIIADMLDACNGFVDRSTAIRALRAVCRYFGGQYIYIPVYKTSGKATEELLGVLVDEAGDSDGEKILEKIMALFGGDQIYIPMEKGAFRDIIAQEIYENYDSSREKMGELCRKYGVSFNYVYKKYHEGKDDKLQMHFDFDEEK